jgi:hypothetical protein
VISAVATAEVIALVKSKVRTNSILFGIIASGIADHSLVLLSSKTLDDFRLLSCDHKVQLQLET